MPSGMTRSLDLNRRTSRLARVVCGLAVCLVAGLTSSASANVRLPNVIGNNMVLQQELPLQFWGWADPGEKVTVELAGQKVEAEANAKGEWKVKLNPLKAEGQTLELIVTGKNTIKLTNILVGEVWVGSGQSNMQWSVQASANPQQEIAAANYPQIRLFQIPLVPSGTPAPEVNAQWQPCVPQTATNFSAVLYFFGREIHKTRKVPVGLIMTAWGGTRIEPWIPPAGFANEPALARELQEWKNLKAAHAKNLKAYAAAMKAWSDKAAATPEGEDVPEPPAAPAHPLNSNNQYTGLYNGMVHAIVPFTIRGALWYQGESNRGAGMHYADLTRGLVNGWRSVWGQDLSFYWVQLAPYRYGNNPTWLPGIWEAQAAAQKIPNTGMAVITDIGNINDIHPNNKQEVGRRLALWALAKTYGQSDVVYSGPVFKSLKVDGNKAILQFEQTAGGLKSLNDKPLTWFSVAGEDKKFVAATAEIQGDTVVVTSPGVAKPVAVRFGWHELAEPNLGNKVGLPASPFRTDTWTDATNAEPAAK